MSDLPSLVPVCHVDKVNYHVDKWLSPSVVASRLAQCFVLLFICFVYVYLDLFFLSFIVVSSCFVCFDLFCLFGLFRFALLRLFVLFPLLYFALLGLFVLLRLLALHILSSSE